MATAEIVTNPADQLRQLVQEVFQIVPSATALDPGQQLAAGLSRPLEGLTFGLPGVTAPVTVTVRWSAHADDAQRTPLVEGRDVRTQNAGAIPATFLFAPCVVEETADGPAAGAATRIVRVEITAVVAPVPIVLPEGPRGRTARRDVRPRGRRRRGQPPRRPAAEHPPGRAVPNPVAAGSRTFGDSVRSIELRWTCTCRSPRSAGS